MFGHFTTCMKGLTIHSFTTETNPFLAKVPILFSLQVPESLWFFGVFRVYKMGTLARNELKRIPKSIFWVCMDN